MLEIDDRAKDPFCSTQVWMKLWKPMLQPVQMHYVLAMGADDQFWELSRPRFPWIVLDGLARMFHVISFPHPNLLG